MTVQSRKEKRFDGSSPVARYWLAQCEGFHVEGPVHGTVEKVVGSVAEQSAESLVVRSAWRRRHIPVDAIEAVVPAERLIVVEEPSREGEPTPHRLAATVAHKAPPLARFVRDAVMMLALLIAAGIIMVIRTLAVVVVGVAQLVTNAVASPATRRRPP
jgi:hypothetical protein